MENLKEKYDCIVVGAGPGGLMAAKTLAENNREVLLIEKNEVIGPKVCAGGLTTKDFKLGIPRKLADKLFKKIYLHTPLQTSTVEDSKPFIATVERKKLGQWMKKEAEKAKVEILHDQVVDLNKDKNQIILKSKGKLSYNYLVGADGSNSIVREKLDLKKEKVLTVFQYLVKKIYPNIEFFFNIEKFGPGYLWIFPHEGFTSIGTGCDPKEFSIKKLRQNFEKWLADNKVDLEGAKFEAWMINYDYQGFEFGNIFLIGDAGGFTPALTGEGMYFAMISGMEAAKKIIDPGYSLDRLNEILKTKKTYEGILTNLETNRTLAEIEMEIVNLMAKTMIFDKKIIKTFS